MLAAIKLMNTVIWAILAGSTVVLPLAGVLRRFRPDWASSGGVRRAGCKAGLPS